MSKPNSQASLPNRISDLGNVNNPQNGIFEYDSFNIEPDIKIDKLSHVQQGLSDKYQFEHTLRDQIINACQGIKACNLALYKPANKFEGICSELRSSIATYERSKGQHSTFVSKNYDHDHHWTDRTYGGRGIPQHYSNNHKSQEPRITEGSFSNDHKEFRKPNHQKKCFICRKIGCWSTKHTSQDRRRAYDKFCQYSEEGNLTRFDQFLFEFEGLETGIEMTNDTEIQAVIADMNMEIEEEDHERTEGQLFAEMGAVDGIKILTILDDQAAKHTFTKEDAFYHRNDPASDEISEHISESFTFKDRYSSYEFQGIMPDTGAAGVSPAANPQFEGLERLKPMTKLDTSTAGNYNIKIGKSIAKSIGTTLVNTPLGEILFHVVPANTPFLFCVQDMDQMGVYLDDLRNVLVQGDKPVPIVRKWGHPFMLLEIEQTLAQFHLTETELKRLHRRFGHSSVRRLERILQRAR
ncbi:hypothetical protein K3495_g10485 [Podosphaera aphanis]|nr:hypothetical protein K3495_g10485 [Podosphaera aphanis]